MSGEEKNRRADIRRKKIPIKFFFKEINND